MADNVTITAGSGTTVAADELTDGTLGSVKVQYVKLMDGTLDSSNKLVIDGSGNMQVIGPLTDTQLRASAVPVTANAGTNLNTSALALESGGNLASIASVVRAEDSASADGDKGVMILARRTASPANTSGTDLDYEPLQINGGKLWVSATIDTALPAGTALIGKAGIDQTTPGTTNAVSIAQLGSTSVATGNGVVGAGTLRVSIASDSTGQVALASGSNTIGALTANQSVNLAQVAGGTASTVATGVLKIATADSGGNAFLSAAHALNSTGTGVQAIQIVGEFDDSSPTSITENQFGNLRMSANRNLYGTIRDAAGNERGANVNASNQLSVTVDNSNVSTNISQINGVTVTMGNGASGTGVQRVTLASDSTGQVTLAAGAATIGALTANQSVNVAQVAGSSASTVATGVQKVGIASSDGTAFLSAANALNSTGGGVQAVQITGQFDDSSPTSITENQFGNIRMSANRNVYHTIRDAAGNERGVNVNASNQMSVSVDNTVTVGSHAVTNAGTFAVQAAGDVASGSSDSGNPVKIGGKAATTNPTAVTDGQRVNAMRDKVGRAVVVQGHVRELVGMQQTTITSNSETTIVTAVASTFLDLTHLDITNSSASAITVTLKDSTAGTTRAIYAIAAGGGINIDFTVPLPQATVNTNWTATCSSGVSSIYINAVFVKNI